MNLGKREFRDFIVDIAHCSKKAQEFIYGVSLKDFRDDEKTLFAVMKAIEIIGEASKKIPENIKQNYSNIPWNEMAGMRDKIVHQYFGINPEILFDVVENHLPHLDRSLLPLMKEFDLEKEIY
jgi:uncharacterized protein with HEPN domain